MVKIKEIEQMFDMYLEDIINNNLICYIASDNEKAFKDLQNWENNKKNKGVIK